MQGEDPIPQPPRDQQVPTDHKSARSSSVSPQPVCRVPPGIHEEEGTTSSPVFGWAGLRRAGSWFFFPLCICAVGCHIAGLQRLQAVRLAKDQALAGQLIFWLLAGGLWFLALLALALRRTSSQSFGGWRSWAALSGLAGLGLLMRLWALPLPVTHSQDVYRYLWDGAVQRAGQNPYLDPPAAARYADVQREQPEVFASINHRHLPTIYPPAAQHMLSLSARLGKRGEDTGTAARRWKLLCGGAELLLWLVFAGLLRRQRIDLRWLSLWLLCPLPAIEIWLNGHIDVVGVLLLGLAVWAWPEPAPKPATEAQAEDVEDQEAAKREPGPSMQPALAICAAACGAALSLAALVKPLAVVVLPGLRRLSRRAIVIAAAAGLLAAVVAWVPYCQAGLRVTPSLGEYGRRWRSNDGAFALLQQTSEVLTAIAYRPPYWAPWRIPALARWVSGRDRATVWPDELAGFLARALSALALGALLRLCIVRRLSAARAGLVLLSGYALLTPVLHPWYLLWPLLLAPQWRRAAWPVLVLCALAPLAYVPLIDELRGQPHREAAWPRLIEHGGAWLAVLWCRHELVQGLMASSAVAPDPGTADGGAAD